MKTIEGYGGYVLVPTSTTEARYRRVDTIIGKLAFGVSVHSRVYRWVMECVSRLGLEDERIAVFRAHFRYANEPRGYLPDKQVLWGAAAPFDGDGKGHNAIYYSPRLRLRDTVGVEQTTTKEVKQLSRIQVTIVHELLHLRYPEKDEEWIEDTAFGICFAGWEALQE